VKAAGDAWSKPASNLARTAAVHAERVQPAAGRGDNDQGTVLFRVVKLIHACCEPIKQMSLGVGTQLGPGSAPVMER